MRLPRPRFTVRRLMVGVICTAFFFGIVRALILNDPMFGMGTVYSENYDETKFQSLHAGMTLKEVEAIMGKPLKIVSWKVPTTGEVWKYSDQPNIISNFWRRWVEFQDGKVAEVIIDYWVD